MSVQLWRHELRRVGWAVWGTPLVVLAFLAVVVVTMAVIGESDQRIGRWSGRYLEIALPLGAALVAVTLVNCDPIRELQLSLPLSYRATVLRRLAVAMSWPALLATIAVAGLAVVGWWRIPSSLVSSQLVWLAPLVWLTSVAVGSALLVRNPTTGSVVAAGIWLIELVFGGLFFLHDWLSQLHLFFTSYLFSTFPPDAPTSDWLVNRLVLLSTAGLALLGVWLLLGRDERLLLEAEA